MARSQNGRSNRGQYWDKHWIFRKPKIARIVNVSVWLQTRFYSWVMKQLTRLLVGLRIVPISKRVKVLVAEVKVCSTKGES